MASRCGHVDVNFSDWDNTLEAGADGALALRLGFRQIDGFREDWADALIAARGNGYNAVGDVGAPRANLPKRALIILAEADCFQSIDMDRREMLWAVRRLADDDALAAVRCAIRRGATRRRDRIRCR